MVYMCDQQCCRETELRCSLWTFCIPQSDLGNVIDQSVSTSFHRARYSSCLWNVPSLNHRGSEKTCWADTVVMKKGRTRFPRGNRMVSHSQSRLQSVKNLPAQHWRGHFLAMYLGLLCNIWHFIPCKLPTFTLSFFLPPNISCSTIKEDKICIIQEAVSHWIARKCPRLVKRNTKSITNTKLSN